MSDKLNDTLASPLCHWRRSHDEHMPLALVLRDKEGQDERGCGLTPNHRHLLPGTGIPLAEMP